MKNIPSNIKIGFIIFFLAFLVRSIQIQNFLFFGFEQGRDAFRVQSLINLQDIILVGPKTDIDGIFHGPWYYYIMTVPYFLGKGNPVVASNFLLIGGSLVAVIIYWWWWELTKNKIFSVAAGLVSATCFELILYSRWLSNVSLAIPFFSLGFYALWKYKITQKTNWFILSLLVWGFAAQFEIILSLWIVITLLLLFVFKHIKIPAKKSLFVALLCFGFWYFPLILFNLKYDAITFRSVWSLIQSNSNQEQSHFISILLNYMGIMFRVWKNATIYLPNSFSAVGGFLALVGIFQGWRYLSFQLKSLVIISTTIIFSTIPVMLFPHSLGLIQVYAGIGIAFLQLTLVGIWSWIKTFDNRKSWWQVCSVAILVLLVVSSGVMSIKNIWLDRDIFYRTIQDDLNLADQKLILNYINEKAPQEPYFVKAFTIPYYQEEGWLYLYQQQVGKKLEPGANVIFVIIEEKVDPYWEKQWITDLGSTKLVEEKKIGRIRVQLRERS